MCCRNLQDCQHAHLTNVLDACNEIDSAKGTLAVITKGHQIVLHRSTCCFWLATDLICLCCLSTQVPHLVFSGADLGVSLRGVKPGAFVLRGVRPGAFV